MTEKVERAINFIKNNYNHGDFIACETIEDLDVTPNTLGRYGIIKHEHYEKVSEIVGASEAIEALRSQFITKGNGVYSGDIVDVNYNKVNDNVTMVRNMRGYTVL